MNIEEIDRAFGHAREVIDRSDLNPEQHRQVNSLLDNIRKPVLQALNRKPRQHQN